MTCEFFDVHKSDKFCISDQNRGISQCYYGEIKEGFVFPFDFVPSLDENYIKMVFKSGKKKTRFGFRLKTLYVIFENTFWQTSFRCILSASEGAFSTTEGATEETNGETTPNSMCNCGAPYRMTRKIVGGEEFNYHPWQASKMSTH